MGRHVAVSISERGLCLPLPLSARCPHSQAQRQCTPDLHTSLVPSPAGPACRAAHWAQRAAGGQRPETCWRPAWGLLQVQQREGLRGGPSSVACCLQGQLQPPPLHACCLASCPLGQPSSPLPPSSPSSLLLVLQPSSRLQPSCSSATAVEQVQRSSEPASWQELVARGKKRRGEVSLFGHVQSEALSPSSLLPSTPILTPWMSARASPHQQ